MENSLTPPVSLRSSVSLSGKDLPRKNRLDAFFQIWKRLSPAPAFIVDIGANHGNWTRLAIKYFPDARYLLIEPQNNLKVHSFDLLLRPNVQWLTAGASDRIGTLTFTLPDRDYSATFEMREAEAERAGFRRIAVPVTTLDAVVLHELRMPDLVKIDAEGHDLRALHGASRLLGTTDVFLVECAVCCRHFESSLAGICAFMEQHGYRAFDFTELIESPKHGGV